MNLCPCISQESKVGRRWKELQPVVAVEGADCTVSL